jgi:hypothetical protein
MRNARAIVPETSGALPTIYLWVFDVEIAEAVDEAQSALRRAGPRRIVGAAATDEHEEPRGQERLGRQDVTGAPRLDLALELAQRASGGC